MSIYLVDGYLISLITWTFITSIYREVLLQCPFYTEQRVRLLTNICVLSPNLLCDNVETTFINMSCNNSKIQFSLAKYIYKVFKMGF